MPNDGKGLFTMTSYVDFVQRTHKYSGFELLSSNFLSIASILERNTVYVAAALLPLKEVTESVGRVTFRVGYRI
jgi:hypothetical protein